MGIRRLMDYMVLRAMDTDRLHVVSGVHVSEPEALQRVEKLHITWLYFQVRGLCEKDNLRMV